MNKSKIVKYFIIIFVIIIIFITGLMIYKNLFSSNSNNRYDGIENYKLTNNEINSVKDKINELEDIESVDVYTNSKIIKIFVKLESDIDFDKVKSISNQTLTSFSDENLSYYDIEIFYSSKNEESEVYPKIGYKYKTTEEFVW